MRKRIDAAPCGIITMTPKGVIHYANQTFADLLKVPAEELLGQHIEMFMNVSNRLMFHTYFYPYLTMYGTVEELLLTLRAKDGSPVPLSISGKKHLIGHAEIIDCVCISMKKRFNYEQELRDIRSKLEQVLEEKNKAYEELHILSEEIHRLARTDELTGLANRRYANQWMDQKLAEMSVGTVFNVIIADIDHFKNINDSYGHAIGDVVLQKVAQILEETVPGGGMVGRYGGEEFIIILPAMTAQQTREIGEEARRAIQAMTVVPKKVTVSLGSAEFMSTDSRESLLSRADRALYFAKMTGRDKFIMDKQVPIDFELRG